MPNFTHRIFNKNWGEVYLVDENYPQYAYSDSDGARYETAGSWLEHYRDPRKASDTKIEVLLINLENK